MTDEMLEWQTKRLLELEVARDGIVVYVRPELVVEVAFNEVQASTQYPGGGALRFRLRMTAAALQTFALLFDQRESPLHLCLRNS